MVDKELFRQLVERPESETLDFKGSAYDLSSEARFDLIKDVISMANTPRETSSYIVLGVIKHSDGSYELPGLQSDYDDSQLRSQFEQRVRPIPLLIIQALSSKAIASE